MRIKYVYEYVSVCAHTLARQIDMESSESHAQGQHESSDFRWYSISYCFFVGIFTTGNMKDGFLIFIVARFVTSN